jgi:aspartyl-tRNA(Asn)/glutamyl-tRNA(Gln) amidotransferase subunit A
MARQVRDAALMLGAIAGHDPADPSSAPVPPDDYVTAIDAGVSGWRVGVIGEEWLGEIHPEVVAAVRAAIDVLALLGAQVEALDVPELQEAAQLNALVTTADAATFHRERLERAPDAFGADVLARLRRGAAYGATDYARARRRQTELRHRFSDWFVEHGGPFDIVALPTSPIPAPRISGLDAVATAGILTRFTAPFNFTGLPALSVPCGRTTEGLPIGLQLVAAPWAERRVLRAGYAYEQALAGEAQQPER